MLLRAHPGPSLYPHVCLVQPVMGTLWQCECCLATSLATAPFTHADDFGAVA